MSEAVALDELREKVDEFGAAAYLVTVGEKGPHVVSVSVAFDGSTFSTTVGRHTAANLDGGGAATLLWPGLPGADYALIVDVAGPADALAPAKAVLHRVATADPSLPNCVRIE